MVGIDRLDELIGLPHSAQVIYLQILYMNERYGQNGTFNLSDKQLMERTRFSKQTITDAKRQLKNSGFIDYRKTAQGSAYEVGKAVGQEVGHMVGNAITTTTNLELPPLPPPPPPPAYARRLDELERRIAALEASRQPSRASEVGDATRQAEIGEDEKLDAVIAEWERRPKFAPLDFPAISKLKNYLGTHTPGEIIAAMDEASLANKATGRYDGVSFIFFEGVLKRMKKPKAKKEGKRDERADSIRYSAPERNGASRWGKYASGTGGADSGEKGIRIDAAG